MRPASNHPVMGEAYSNAKGATLPLVKRESAAPKLKTEVLLFLSNLEVNIISLFQEANQSHITLFLDVRPQHTPRPNSFYSRLFIYLQILSIYVVL